MPAQGVFSVSTDVTDSLLGWWKFDEGSGTTTTDSSGGGNTVTLSNSLAWTTQSKKGAAALNCGNAQYYASAPVSLLGAIADYSISLWARLFSTGSPGVGLVVNNKLQTYIDAGNGLDLSSDGGSTNLSAANAVPADLAYHLIVFTRTSGGAGVIYVDAVSVASGSTGTPATTASHEAIGSISGANIWRGYIDDVRFYSRILNQADVQNIYTAP